MNSSNPKDVVGSTKLPLWTITFAMVAGQTLALLDGLLKYGRLNWRKTPITLSEYISATRRHLDAMMEGEEFDPDSGVDHLYHAQATLGIIADARAHGTLIDDRNYAGDYRKLATDLTPHVKRLREKHAGKNPKHYTIADNLVALPPANWSGPKFTPVIAGDGWREWKGGACPVPGETLVDVHYRRGTESTSNPYRADGWEWRHGIYGDYDIIAWRPAKGSKPNEPAY